VDVVEGDVRNPDCLHQLMHGADIIFHTAAVVQPWVREAGEMYAINEHASVKIVSCALDRDLPVVYTSSITALDPFPRHPLIDHLDPNHYVRAKRNALALVRRARSEGAKVATVLPSGVIGPGDREPTAIGRLVMGLMKGTAPTISFPGGLYLVDVRDVAWAHIRASTCGPRDYVLPGEFWPLEQLFDVVSTLGGRQARHLRVPMPIAVLGAAVMSAWADLVTRRAPIITPAWVHYFSKAQDIQYPDDALELGISMRRVVDSLKDAVGWFQGRRI